MRVAIIADTHMPKGSRHLPPRCLAELERADLIVHLGDFWAASVLAELEQLGPPLLAVAGNVDEPALRRRLPQRTVLAAEDVQLGLVHDAGPRPGRLGRLRGGFPDADAALFGHSHLPRHEEAGGFQIFNPGSPTERRRAPERSMGVARIERGRIRFEHIGLD